MASQGSRGFTGARGPSGSMGLGTVTITGPGTLPTIENVGTADEAILNFSIPVSTSGGGGSTNVAVLIDVDDSTKFYQLVVKSGAIEVVLVSATDAAVAALVLTDIDDASLHTLTIKSGALQIT